jgi:GH18 family chitinase
MFAFLALSVLATLSYGLPITPTATTGSVSGTMSSAPSQATASSSALGRGSNGTVAAAWFEGWSSTFNASSIPWDKYTHVTYSFA